MKTFMIFNIILNKSKLVNKPLCKTLLINYLIRAKKDGSNRNIYSSHLYYFYFSFSKLNSYTKVSGL